MLILATLFLLGSVAFTESAFCNDGSNPCRLDKPDSLNAYFLPKNGYYCMDAFNGQIICTCPDNSTRRDRPCRICDRNPCGVGPSVVACTDINLSYSCLCNNHQGELVVSTTTCDDSIVKPPVGDSCQNDGVRDPATNLCNCPSGFTGKLCEDRADEKLCERVQCMSNGVCAIRPSPPLLTSYESKCLCRMGTDGDYCERQNRIGTCIPNYCLNEGVCEERDVANTRYASCRCKPGWVGPRCEKQYFYCYKSGYFIDEYLKNQGKYFACVQKDNGYLLSRISCPKGLKFNPEKELCLY